MFFWPNRLAIGVTVLTYVDKGLGAAILCWLGLGLVLFWVYTAVFADLIVTHAAKAMPAAACSTGEQKALLIAIVLAHAGLVAERSGRPPILLLDEIVAHLDASRRAALFEQLAAMGVQAWMTGTDATLFADLAGSRLPTSWLAVAAGRITPA